MSAEAKNDNTKPKVDLGLLEEDDEFEEFPADGKDGAFKLSYVVTIGNLSENFLFTLLLISCSHSTFNFTFLGL